MSRGSHRSKNGSNYAFKRESAFKRETSYIKSIFKPPEGSNKLPQPLVELELEEGNGQACSPNGSRKISKEKGKSVHDHSPDSKRKN